MSTARSHEPKPARKRGVVVAIDGPAGAGKSTLAQKLATAMGLPFVSTGQMYRAVALLALEERVDPGDAEGLAALASRLRFDLERSSVPAALSIDGRLPPEVLASPRVEAIVSRVASHPAVRAVLRARQRELGASGAVMEGRDIGSVVFPDADVKVLLMASPEVRSARREGQRARDRQVGDAVRTRDTLDARTTPMDPAPGALMLDSSRLSADEAFGEVLRLVRERLGEVS
jgi:cytidylate kinase